MACKKKNRLRKGFSILEVLLVVAMFAIFSTGVFYLSLDSLQRTAIVNSDNSALLYAQEGLEAVRNIRDRNFLLLTNGDHGLELSGGQWGFVTAPESVDGFYERVITIEDVYRNVSGDIDENGSELDPDVKRITSEVSWLSKGVLPRSVKLETLLSNWRGNDWITTTCADFNTGGFTDTVLGTLPAPPTDNCGLLLEDIEGVGGLFGTTDVGKHGTDVVVEGSYAYLGVNEEGGGFATINVSDPANPFVAGVVDIGQKGRYVHKSGNNVYVGVQSDVGGLAIVNVSNPASPSLSTVVDLTSDGNEPEVIGNYLFMAVNLDGLRVFDISNPSDPQLVETFDFGDTVYVSEAQGNYLYVGLADDAQGFRILDISDPLNVQQIAALDVGEEVNSVYLSWPVAYLGTENVANSLQVVDISDPVNPAVVASSNAGGEIQDIVISGDSLYAAIDDPDAGLAMVNISSPYNPRLVYNLDVAGKGTGIDADSNYIYVSTDTANKGLVIVQKGDSSIALSGEYISEALDTGSVDPEYKFIEWDHVEVPGGSVKFQIRTAGSESGLDTATWVGPDGTSGSFFTTSRTQIVLSPDRSGSRFVQYRILLESDGVSTPVVESVRINFIP